jgi:hypothetical protein
MLSGKVIGVVSESGGGYRRYSSSRRYQYVTMYAKYYLLVELGDSRIVSVLAKRKSRSQSHEVVESTKKRLGKKYLGREVAVRFGLKEYVV